MPFGSAQCTDRSAGDAPRRAVGFMTLARTIRVHTKVRGLGPRTTATPADPGIRQGMWPTVGQQLTVGAGPIGVSGLHA